jgi:exoribonuclease R
MRGILQTKDYAHFAIIDSENNTIILKEFDGANYAKGCLSGDTVEWKDNKCVFVERGNHDLLVGTLELSSKTTYGLNARGHSLYLFVPYSKQYPPFIVGSSEKDRSCNRLAVVKFDNWDSAKSQFPRGNLQQILGPCGDLKAEEEALRWQAFPWQSLRNKDVEVRVNKDENNKKRTRISSGKTFNIDPAGCKDIDDIVTIEPIAFDTWSIIITIADVACYVEEMSAIDILASTFGQTLYHDGNAICPMLPPTYSEDHCSLLPGKERHGVSLSFEWDCSKRTIKNIKWFESVFVNEKSYTYEEFQESKEQERYILQQVATDLEQKKELIEDSHKWIEALMKLYNIEAGKLLKEVGVGILRKHTGPRLEDLKKYSQWDVALERLAQSSAEYCLASESDTTHYGIAVDAYCHASSPIRRYADLMNQRLLKQIIQGNKEGLFVTVPVEDLNLRSKMAKSYERNLLFVRSVLGGKRTFDNVRIININSNKVVLWITEWQKTVSIRMKQNEMGQFVSADEKYTYELHEGDLVSIEFAINLAGRFWKDRMIIRILQT